MELTVKQVVKRLSQISSDLVDNYHFIHGTAFVQKGASPVFETTALLQERASLLSERRILKLKLIKSNLANHVTIDDGSGNDITICVQDLYELINNNKNLLKEFHALKVKACSKPPNSDLNYDLDKIIENIEILRDRVDYLNDMLGYFDSNFKVEVE